MFDINDSISMNDIKIAPPGVEITNLNQRVFLTL